MNGVISYMFPNWVQSASNHLRGLLAKVPEPLRRVWGPKNIRGVPTCGVCLQCPTNCTVPRYGPTQKSSEVPCSTPISCCSAFGVSLECLSRPRTSHPATPTVVLGIYSCYVCRLARCCRITLLMHVPPCSWK